MKSINKTKNDSISEQASVTKEEMIEFASKYKNIEAFKDFDDETTYWFIMLFILLMYIDYNTQKLWESFAEEVKTKNRFFPESELLKKISDIAEKATCTISKGDILYRARDYTKQDFFKNDMVIALSEIMKDEFSNLEFDARNKTLMKMFNMIGIGERAGSGIPDIYQVWENEGWPMPVVEESYNPDRTRLSLEFAKKQTIKTSEEEKEPKRSQKGAEKEPIKGAERKKEILKLIKVNSTITQVEIMKELDLTRKQVQKDMKELQEMHIIAREGTNRRGRWIIVKENK